MAVVQGAFHHLLLPGLVEEFKKWSDKLAGLQDVELGVPSDGNLHVYDLGSGMLVPTTMVRDLFGKG